MSVTEDKQQARSRRTLLLIAAVCFAPFVGSFALYYFWQPAGRVNYGDLLQDVQLPAVTLPRDGENADKVVDLAKLRGRWLFVTLDSGACNEYCQKKLWQIRQVRMTQGKYPERIERVLLLTDDAPLTDAVRKEYDGTHMARARDHAILKILPAKGASTDHIWLVDPLGNIVLRYPKDADPSRMKKDLTRVLRVSRIG